MRAVITLAEAATRHPDGTVSVLRAGINRVSGAHAPFILHAAQSTPAMAIKSQHTVSGTGEVMQSSGAVEPDATAAWCELARKARARLAEENPY